MTANIEEFDYQDLINRVGEHLGWEKSEAEALVSTVLDEIENALCEHGRVEFHGRFSIALKVRQPKVVKGFGGETHSLPKRLQPKIKFFDRLRALAEEKQGLPCT